MKIKNLLLAGLAVFALSACSNDDDVKSQSSFEGDMVLRVSTPGLSPSHLTRTADEKVSDGAMSEIKNLQIVLFSNGLSVKSHSLTKESELEAAKNGYRIAKVDGGVNKVLVFANHTTGAADLDKIKTGLTEQEVLALLNGVGFNKIQPNEAGISAGIKSAPLEFSTTDFTNVTQEGDVKVVKIAAKLVPAIARVQVSGKINYHESVKEAKVTLISMDNFLKENYKADKYTIEQNNHLSNPTIDDIYAKLFPNIFDTDFNGSDLSGKEYAYHLFPQTATGVTKDSSVKMILRVEFKAVPVDAEGKPTNDGSLVEYVRYSTLRLALGTKNVVNEKDPFVVEGGLLYNISLGYIDWNGDGVVDDDDKYTPDTGKETPNPTDEFMDLNVIVSVQGWKATTVIPQN